MGKAWYRLIAVTMLVLPTVGYAADGEIITCFGETSCKQGKAVIIPDEGVVVGNFLTLEEALASARNGNLCVRRGGVRIMGINRDGRAVRWEWKDGFSTWIHVRLEEA